MAFSSRGNERARFTTKRLGYRTILTGIFFASSRRIHVYVDDVNEFIPLWSEQEYNGQLEEGDLSSFILQVKKIITDTEIDIILNYPQVQATDNDCSPSYGDVCKYSISGAENEAVFSVDQQGIITNTQPLWTRSELCVSRILTWY